jgi:hypothetical protein
MRVIYTYIQRATGSRIECPVGITASEKKGPPKTLVQVYCKKPFAGPALSVTLHLPNSDLQSPADLLFLNQVPKVSLR